ncbi:hypothetical protein ACFPRL_34135 [Pseudoclavibacter helvolus]
MLEAAADPVLIGLPWTIRCRLRVPQSSIERPLRFGSRRDGTGQHFTGEAAHAAAFGSRFLGRLRLGWSGAWLAGRARQRGRRFVILPVERAHHGKGDPERRHNRDDDGRDDEPWAHERAGGVFFVVGHVAALLRSRTR